MQKFVQNARKHSKVCVALFVRIRAPPISFRADAPDAATSHLIQT